MDIADHNRKAWDRQVEIGNTWTLLVSHEEVEAARRGDWRILLPPEKPVPREWFGTIEGAKVLCLASGGGQQGPILAAAGAQVAVFDNSPAQLAQDEQVAKREKLNIGIELGRMEDLSRFSESMFDLIVHPVSNLFAADVRKVWREAFRVLQPGGALLSGFANPANYLFDQKQLERGRFTVRYSLPYSDRDSLSADDLKKHVEKQEPLEFSHSLDDQIGGQIDAGFAIVGFYEDRWRDDPLDKLMPTFMATRALMP